jgi:hypothetical protein
MADAKPELTVVSTAAVGTTNEAAHKDDEAAAAHNRGPTASRPSQDAEPAPATPRQPAGEPQDGYQRFVLKDIQVGSTDSRGFRIARIYAVQSGEYAIYQADEVMAKFSEDPGKAQAKRKAIDQADEVMIQFSDDPGKAQAQRKSILPVSSARAVVSALSQGLPCREVCDRQLAYALQLALDGDLDAAKETVAAAKAFVLAKRASRGRFQYLKSSYLAAAVLIGVLFVASSLFPLQPASSNLWLAAKAGLIGAAFSIALAIRGRTVALDTDLLDNVTDGILRLLIGVISAGVLLLLFTCGIVPGLKIGDAHFKAGALTWEMVLVIGFIGGFLERLVPDLLDKKNSQSNGSNATVGAGAHG